MFLNADISSYNLLNMFKLSVVVVNTYNTIMEGFVTKISYLGPRSNFMQFRNLGFQKLQTLVILSGMSNEISCFKKYQ